MNEIQRVILGIARNDTGAASAVKGVFTFDRGDPFAVVVDLWEASKPEPVRWEFARSLLAEGLCGFAGSKEHGDVLVWSTISAAGRSLHIKLRPPKGEVTIEMPWAAVQEFVTASKTVVRIGAEKIPDSEFTALLDGTLPPPL